MNNQSLLHLLELQQNKINKRYKDSFYQTIKDEYVIEPIYSKRIEYLDNLYRGKKNEEIFNNIIDNPITTRKTIDFDISRHDVHERMYYHNHTFIEIDYVYKGTCQYFLGHDGYYTYLNEKQCCILNQNMIHAINLQDPESIIIKCMIPIHYLNINDFQDSFNEDPLYQFLKHSVINSSSNASFLIYDLAESSHFEICLHNLLHEYVYQNLGWRQVIKNNLSSMLLAILRQNSSSLLEAHIDNSKELNMAKIIAHIRINYKNITLRDLANELHFHENYLGQRIKEYLKMSFKDYLLEIRINEAKRLLKETKIPVKAISNKIGYESPSFFYKLFKKEVGITPLNYRNATKGD